MLHVRYDLGVGDLSTNETLGIEDGVLQVHHDLVLGRVADKTFGVREDDIGQGGSVILVVRDNLDMVVLPDTNARVGGAERER